MQNNYGRRTCPVVHPLPTAPACCQADSQYQAVRKPSVRDMATPRRKRSHYVFYNLSPNPNAVTRQINEPSDYRDAMKGTRQLTDTIRDL